MSKTIGVILTLKDLFSPKLKKAVDLTRAQQKQLRSANLAVEKFGKKMKTGMAQVAQASAVGFGAIVAGSVALSQKTAEAGDRVDKMSQKIGMSRKAFQEWDYVMSQNGGSVDSLQMGYKTLAKQMDGARKGSKDTTAIFNKLGVSIKDNSGQLRSQDEVFNESVRALQSIKNPTEKAIMAQKLFGKSAIEMKPLLNQSADSVENLRNKANALGMVMSDEAVDASVKFTDTQDTLMRAFGAVGITIGSQLIPIMQKASDFMLANMPKIKQITVAVLNPITKVLGFLADHIQAVTIVAGLLCTQFIAFKVISTVNTYVSAFNTMMKATEGVLTGVQIAQKLLNMTMLGSPIFWISAGIALLIGGLVLLVKNWDTVTATVQKWGATVVQWFSGVWATCQAVFGTIGTFIKTHFVDILLFALGPIGLIIKGIQNIGGAIGAIKNKGGNGGDTNKGKPSKHAVGTSYFAGGATQINEGGRGEIVNLPSGSQIIPHDIAKNTSKNINIKVDFNIAGNVIGKAELFNDFAQQLTVEIQNKLQTV